MRIDKFLSQLKYCTRSQAKAFLKTEKIIYRNVRILSPQLAIDPICDKIFLNGKEIFYQNPIHLMIYKPIGYLSANHDTIHPCVVDLLAEPYNRFDYAIAGRLDIDAHGLIILTTEGLLAHQIMSPKTKLVKIYQVILDQPFSHERELLEGVWLFDAKQEKYFARALSIETKESYVELSIDEGKFHQVKRTFQAVGYQVLDLKRTQIGNLTLKELKPGTYIPFEKEELF